MSYDPPDDRGDMRADPFDRAWVRAERRVDLPHGWWLHSIAAYSFGDHAYLAEAATAGRSASGYGATPSDALDALRKAIPR